MISNLKIRKNIKTPTTLDWGLYLTSKGHFWRVHFLIFLSKKCDFLIIFNRKSLVILLNISLLYRTSEPFAESKNPSVQFVFHQEISQKLNVLIALDWGFYLTYKGQFWRFHLWTVRTNNGSFSLFSIRIPKKFSQKKSSLYWEFTKIHQQISISHAFYKIY